MRSARFEEPVTIFVGLGYPRLVESVSEAHQILCDWHGARGPAHAAALKACRAALHDEIDAETACGVFIAFAKARGVLAPDMIAAVGTLAQAGRLAGS